MIALDDLEVISGEESIRKNREKIQKLREQEPSDSLTAAFLTIQNASYEFYTLPDNYSNNLLAIASRVKRLCRVTNATLQVCDSNQSLIHAVNSALDTHARTFFDLIPERDGSHDNEIKKYREEAAPAIQFEKLSASMIVQQARDDQRRLKQRIAKAVLPEIEGCLSEIDRVFPAYSKEEREKITAVRAFLAEASEALSASLEIPRVKHG